MDRTEQEIHMAMSEPKIGAKGEDFWSRHCHMNLLRGSVHGLTFSNMYLQFMESIKYFYIHCHLFKNISIININIDCSLYCRWCCHLEVLSQSCVTYSDTGFLSSKSILCHVQWHRIFKISYKGTFAFRVSLMCIFIYLQMLLQNKLSDKDSPSNRHLENQKIHVKPNLLEGHVGEWVGST